MRVVLIGGTSNVGKSTAARQLAVRLGFAYQSTDHLARHPGRPWRTPDREVPPHVVEHYATLTVDELLDSVHAHYARLWPRIEELITTHPGLVLEGSALWPVPVSALDLPDVAAVWLTADEAVLRARIHGAAGYAELLAHERFLVDQFLARTVRFQERLQELVVERGLTRLDVSDGGAVADAVLAAVPR
ncbi:hypothetical protein GCM10022222_83330 [Amycolatopsis ultiminotia]|uniref:AAA domain-containing protein n=1 Tax=Amycolatopsis ultiminotia TaxID=543629 RepID=A0ABP6YLF8_9PSEU